MKKQYLKCIFAFILLLIIIVPTNSFSISSSGGYTIESYDIDIVVNENNTFDITERITTNFSTTKHGIFRKIPLKNTVKRTDGTTSNNRAKITNLSVSEEYTTSKENGYEVIKIGNSDQTVIGKHSYTIKYTYNIGKDPLKNADELYYNLIGNEWDTNISNVTFKIKMPKSFDEELLGFSSGYRDSTNSSNVFYTVDGNVISGKLNNTLSAGQALTVRLTLPEGYFVGASNNVDMYPVAIIIISLICVLIAYRLWVKYGKDDNVVETVEFYPPENYNSAEVGFLYEGTAETPAVISLLIYLANKGYLKIEETEAKGILKKSKGFRITKIKDYDGNDENEKIFFNGLFKYRKNSDTEKISVTANDLYDNFYTTLDKIKRNLNSKENKNKIFESFSIGKRKWLRIMAVVLFILITVKPVLEYSAQGVEILPFALLFPGIGFTVLIEAFIGGKKTTKIFAIIWGLMFGGMPWVTIVLPTLMQNTMYIVMYAIGIICISVILLFVKIMPKRTPYGNEILGKLRGFKRFLETAEKPKLESLVSENPEYFYNILPYTYALGVSDVWIRQFETIALQAPNWYDSRDDFNMHNFGTFMTSTMASATTAMSSSPSSDSGGGSSGGGSSGGGSGGGGGGSW